MVNKLCEYRLLIGFLGEKQLSSWWDCSFLSSSSPAFLAPIYPKSILLAQYTGVCQAASIIHDEHIGIGRHYHLYRLPDSIEWSISKCLQDEKFALQIKEHLTDKYSALNRLKELGAKKIDRSEGPVSIGDFSDTRIHQLIRKSLSYYLNAFENDYKSFPYMRCL